MGIDGLSHECNSSRVLLGNTRSRGTWENTRAGVPGCLYPIRGTPGTYPSVGTPEILERRYSGMYPRGGTRASTRAGVPGHIYPSTTKIARFGAKRKAYRSFVVTFHNVNQRPSPPSPPTPLHTPLIREMEKQWIAHIPAPSTPPANHHLAVTSVPPCYIESAARQTVTGRLYPSISSRHGGSQKNTGIIKAATGTTPHAHHT